MFSSLLRYLGTACCIAGAILILLQLGGKQYLGNVYSPFLLVGIGLLLLLRARVTRS